MNKRQLYFLAPYWRIRAHKRCFYSPLCHLTTAYDAKKNTAIADSISNYCVSISI